MEVSTLKKGAAAAQALGDLLKATHRGYVIPPRPEKSPVEGQRASADFVEARRAALEHYLHQLAGHPVLSRSQARPNAPRRPSRVCGPQRGRRQVMLCTRARRAGAPPAPAGRPPGACPSPGVPAGRAPPPLSRNEAPADTLERCVGTGPTAWEQ